MDSQRISIIIPVYNVEIYLKRCINSIIDQSYHKLEIILVDDGSTDNSGNLCDEYANRDRRIKVIHQQNQGLPGARNTGLRLATADYVGFIDSDDYICQDMYEYLYKLLKCSGADIAACGINTVYTKNGKVKTTIRDKPTYTFNQEEALMTYQYDHLFGCTVWNKLFKRKLFENITFSKVSRLEDSLVLCKCLCASSKIIFGTECKYIYSIRENSITQRKFGDRNYDILKVTDKSFRLVKKKFPLNPQIEMGRILWYTVFINEMIKGKGIDSTIINKTKAMIRRNSDSIIKNNQLTNIRKIQLLLLKNNYYLYKFSYLIYLHIRMYRLKLNYKKI